ncbi:MAG: SH3 domain-containing protein [Aliarcobacter sp.]|nr:SH3 domain-containing protein [Aliarcobacter sp.]
MKKISLIVIGFLITFNLYAEEQNIQNTMSAQSIDDMKKMENIDKLDILDQQSKEFFNAITGLEKDYLEEQIDLIKNKKTKGPEFSSKNKLGGASGKEIIELSQEDYEKNVFTHQNEMARLTTDFTRTKKLKDLKIKSMYSFNGHDYVVLELIETSSSKNKTELSANIEGRYIEGDSILGHKLMNINTRTKSISLYKKLDEDYGYTIYLSNYGISVSDLEKISKNEKKLNKEKKEEVTQEERRVENKIENKSVQALIKESDSKNNDCKYIVKSYNLNVRNKDSLNARILRVLKTNDQFTIQEKDNQWVKLNTIYKEKSGDVMNVSNENNWLQIIDGNVIALNADCK